MTKFSFLVDDTNNTIHLLKYENDSSEYIYWISKKDRRILTESLTPMETYVFT